MSSIRACLQGVALGLVLVLNFGCSAGNEPESQEKGVIEQATDKVADQAVKKIKTPLDNARATRDLGDERLQSIDETMKKQ